MPLPPRAPQIWPQISQTATEILMAGFLGAHTRPTLQQQQFPSGSAVLCGICGQVPIVEIRPPRRALPYVYFLRARGASAIPAKVSIVSGTSFTLAACPPNMEEVLADADVARTTPLSSGPDAPGGVPPGIRHKMPLQGKHSFRFAAIDHGRPVPRI